MSGKITASSKLQPAFHLRSSLLLLVLLLSLYEYMNKNGIISTEITPQLSPVIVALFSQVATLTAAQFHTINAIVMVNKEYI